MAVRFPRARNRSDDLAATNGHGQIRRGLRASAVGIDLDNRKALRNFAARRHEWQTEAWAYFDDIGEVKYPARRAGNVMSKLRFFVAVRPLDNPEGDPIGVFDEGSGIPTALAARATAELERLKSAYGGRAEIVRMLQINLEVVAEANLVGLAPRISVAKDPMTGEDVETITGESWEIRSNDEIVVENDGKKVTLKTDDLDDGIVLDKEKGDRIVRIWERHPRKGILADNAMRGVLSICESLILLENQVKAHAKSHASAGFMTFPSELSYIKDPFRTPEGDGDEDEGANPFLDAYNEQLAEPIENPSSAASVAPMPIIGPAEFLKPDVLRHISLAQQGDDKIDEKIEGRILRLARGLNHPVEMVTGLMATTFANASEVSESDFRDHYEPRAVLMCDAFTVGFLQQNLIDAGENPDLVERLIIWFDPSQIVKGIEPTASAKEGWEIGAISDAAWRRVMGWTEDDAPDPLEKLLRILLKLRALDPGISTAIVELLGIPLNIPSAVPAGPSEQTNPPNLPPNPDEVPSPPTQSIERTELSLAQALILFVDAHQKGQIPHPSVVEKVSAVSSPDVVRAARRKLDRANVGRQLMEIDRDLRTKLLVAAHSALMRVEEKAGNRLKTKVTGRLAAKRGKDTDVRMLIGSLHPRYVAATLGPELVASTGLSEDDLIGADAWSGLEQQFMAWGHAAQVAAVGVAAKVVPLSKGERAALRTRQAASLKAAWTWLADALHTLAVERLYQPDPTAPDVGEFDPHSSIPAGLIRQAIARAGGATGISPGTGGRLAAAVGDSGNGIWVFTNNGDPPGGIGTGEDVIGALTDAGAGLDGYEWTYGPAFRKSPFEPHVELDGVQFVNFDDDQLAAGDWIGDFYFPGDHDGCSCDVTPIIIGPDETGDASTSISDLADLTEVTADNADDTPLDDRDLLAPDHVSDVVAQANKTNEPATVAYMNDQTALDLNRALRSGETSYTDDFWQSQRAADDARDLVTALDAAGQATPLSEDTLLYRGAAMTSVEVTDLLAAGGIEDAGFVSTSTSDHVAKGYATARGRMGNGQPVLFKIAAPAGTPAFQGAFGSNEIVLGRGLQWRVVEHSIVNGVMTIGIEAI